jgi:FtsH-binding integral membrane protein
MFTKTSVLESNQELAAAMSRVYAHMGVAVTVSMITSYFIGTTPEIYNVLFSNFSKWIMMFLPLLLLFPVSFILHSKSISNHPLAKIIHALALYVFAASMGASTSTVFAHFTLGSIYNAFMGAAVLFGTMSLYGYFTKKDLTTIGSICIVGLIAIIISSIINIFIGSALTQTIISGIAIIIFLGLTAYDTQNIKENVLYGGNSSEVAGALTLYLDFINLFLQLLQFVGVTSDD